MNTSLLVALAERIGWTLLHSLWQGAVVALFLTLVLRLLRRRSAAARHAASMLALFAFAALVVGTAWRVGAAPPTPRTMGPRMAAAMENDGPQIGRSGAPITTSAADTVDSMNSQGVAASTIRSAVAAPLRSAWSSRFAPLLPWMSALWLFGVALLTLRHLVGWRRLRALRRSGTPARHELQESFVRLLERFGCTARVRLLESAEAAVPLLAGLCKPAVLLPVRVITGLGEHEIEAILAHELAHLARRDAWSNFAQVAIETLFFYHPAVWWMGRCARLERENAADDLALKVCADRRVYAGALAHLAELRFGPQPALAASGGNLLARIQRIVRPASVEPLASGWSLGIPALLVALAIAAVYRVQADDAKTINVAPGESIQAAIDAAPAGATIHLGAGEWRERIIISKPLTLEGEGWEKTRIAIEEPPTAEITKAYEEGNAAAKAAATPEAIDQASIALIQRARRPAIFVHSAEGVTVRDLRVQGVSKAGSDAGHTLSTLVYFYRTKGVMTRCAVVGPFGDGVRIGGGAEVEIRGSLVAALWGDGITVLGAGQGEARPASRLHLVESEVRNVYHYGIALGPGCDSTIIERCRIAGTAWHGIRYDHASPTISGNTIFQHARFGIYASGKTHAIVRGNLFWKCEMAGIGCWFENTDAIEGNTFTGNLRSGLEVIGDGKPAVSRNVFANNPVAIGCGGVASRDGKPSAIGDPVLTNNLFHENPIAVQRKEKEAAPEGSINADPKFRDPARQDFALVADSPARQASIGVAEPLAPAGPWPLLAEEKAIIPADDTRDFSSWTAPGAPKKSKVAEKAAAQSANDAKPWIDDAFQLEDAAKRAAAIERIRTAMTSGNADEARTGVTAFVRLGPIEFDKASFRPAVSALLASPDAPTRAAAASAFTMTGVDPDDLPRIFALADDPAPEVRDGLTIVIVQLTKYDLREKAASDAILKLMANLPRDSRSVAHSLWGSKFSPEIEAKVLEFTRDIDHASNSSIGYNFFYGSLSTQANKSEASCKRLIELLAHQDTTNIAGRSAWGLQQGVDRAQFPLVADAMMKVIEARSDGYVRNNALRCLRMYGSAAHAPALKAILAKPGVTGDLRKTLEETLAALEARPASSSEEVAKSADAKVPSQSAIEAKGADGEPKPTTSTNAPALEKPEIEVQWKGKWWPATILKKDGERTQIHYVGYGSEWDEWVTLERVRPFVAGADTNDKALPEAERIAKLVEKNRLAARARAEEDRKNYTWEQLQEIEKLYQVANAKGKRAPEAVASLKQLLEKYDKANRTGCATLYLGQASLGAERLDYLTRAVEKFSDCYYFNGCQVGGYGRYVLALTLWEKGDKDKARALIAELKTTYKDATDHRGRPITELAEAAEKELAAKQ